MKNHLDDITKLMALAPTADSYAIQRRQTAHRIAIADTWQVQPDENILEIGCGQGDLSTVLADRVGPGGHVTGIDIAPREYGAPLTLGQAWDHLFNGPLAKRLTVHFNTNLTNGLGSLADQHFDRIVMAHSLWYFESANALALLLNNLRTIGDFVDVAEWSLQPTALNQIGHLQAAMIQGLLYAIAPSDVANIRTLITPDTLTQMAHDHTWTYTAGQLIEDPDLDDARWEIATTNALLTELKLSTDLRDRVKPQLEAMQHNGTATLPTFTGRITF
ncbi:SAM-dependent methyltransferase [Lacticaseibacillus chiayiensis]|uniref:Methyltransferase domain-containing protein n=1 Tax=Lacticaseibacillus chiayiensis TaxID=2100821 RepID=A0A4Q1U914_9LACO|nr:class I SAM-dependent methyltransferase [Lacticaseibacillus chiayiensis]QVI34450.1 methyltransferase domain-containing protein [Lacticaseibacillus chiayiensis]RXT27873.1 SAM-dependent methyltransferase [Lacticaseibacillus chiayiensis]UYN56186.1 methyltransferase domain-containing protein [Lacticaseibacillus chiayiensis]